MDLTQEIILQHGRFSSYKGQLDDPDVSAKLENPLCGDSLKIDIKIIAGKVIDICYSGEGCLISQAAASLLLGQAKKVKDINKIKKFDKDSVLDLLGIKLTLTRLNCALLSLQVLQTALIDY